MVQDRPDVAHALSRNAMRQIITEDGKGQGAENQDHAEEHRGEATADVVGSNSSFTREETLHSLGRMEEFVAGKYDYDCRTYLRET